MISLSDALRTALVVLLQDANARATRALEALIDGDLGLAEQILFELSGDLDRALARGGRST